MRSRIDCNSFYDSVSHWKLLLFKVFIDTMNNVHKTYPQSLAGLYEVDFLNLVLKPIKLANAKIADFNLIEIKFVCGMGNAVFENGFIYVLNVKFDEKTTDYTFRYRKADHIFSVTAHLGGLCTTVDIMSLTDFGAVPKD